MRPRLLLAALVLTRVPTSAHDVITTPVTFAREISRLFYQRCVSCHHAGGRAFSLATYNEARPWAKAIKEEILERRMPPWGAVKGFGNFRDDQGLTQEQIELIADWVEGGAPEGNPALLPKLPGSAPAAATPAARAAETAVAGSLTLKSPMTLAGVRPRQVPEGASLMVTATRPDGSVEPLLWLYDFHSRFARTYFYAAPLRLPTGARIEVTPPTSGTVALIRR